MKGVRAHQSEIHREHCHGAHILQGTAVENKASNIRGAGRTHAAQSEEEKVRKWQQAVLEKRREEHGRTETRRTGPKVQLMPPTSVFTETFRQKTNMGWQS